MKKDLKNFIYFARLILHLDKKYLIFYWLDVVLKCCSPFALVIFPKFILNEIMVSRRINYIIFYLLLMAVTDIIINVLIQITEPKINNRVQHLRAKMGIEFSKHVLNMDYTHLENAKIMDLKQKAVDFIYAGGGLENITFTSQNFFVAVGRIVGYGAIILTCNPILILLIIFSSIFSARLQGKAEKYSYDAQMEIVRPNRKGNYLDFVCSDYSHVKDIRFNGITDWILEKRKTYNDIKLVALNKVCNKFVGLGFITTLVNNLLNILYYVYLIYMLFKKTLLIGDFTMYLSSITNFTQAVNNLFIQYARLTQSKLKLNDYIEFTHLQNVCQSGIKKIQTNKDFTIEFCNVSFKYPNSDTYSLKNVNVTINAKEKISVVGENGAGKSTFIKLLLRLYDPTEGSILLNGIDIKEYDYQEYINFFSVLFQDYHLFELSIKENVAFWHADIEDDNKILELLNQVGLEEKMKGLKFGVNTVLSKQMDEDGTNLSGGESQKIAIARVVYRNSPMVILDEPTSALDPLAEYEIYKIYNKLVYGRTSIFISHRMASTRLADRIFVFKAGELVECGSHEQLIKIEGVYKEMFHLQAQYYVD